MKRNAQTTLFIGIGIVMLILLGLAYYVSTPPAGVERVITPVDSLTRAEQQLSACWDVLDRAALRDIGMQGGWDSPPDGVSNGLSIIGYAANANQVALPPLSVIETEVASHAAARYGACGIDIPGITYTPGTFNIRVIINDDKTLVVSSTDGTLSTDSTSRKVADRTDTINTRFGWLLARAREFAQGVADDPDDLDVLPLAEQGIDVTLRAFGPLAWIAEFREESGDSAIVKLSGRNEDVISIRRAPRGPSVQQPAPLTLTAGESKNGIIIANDPAERTLTFTSLSPLMAIGPTDGAYTIRTTHDDIGQHEILVEVSDEDGRTATAYLEVTVV